MKTKENLKADLIIGIKKYNTAEKKIIEIGKDIEKNLVMLYHLLSGNEIDITAQYACRNWQGDPRSIELNIKAKNNKLRIKSHCGYYRGADYHIDIRPKRQGLFRRDSGIEVVLGSIDPVRIRRMPAAHFFTECSALFKEDPSMVSFLIENVSKIPSVLLDHFRAKERQGMESLATLDNAIKENFTNLVNSIDYTALYQSNPAKFQALFNGISKEDQMNVIEQIFQLDPEKYNKQNQSWLEQNYTSLIKEVGRDRAIQTPQGRKTKGA